MAEMEGCAKCMKYLLFVINLIIFLCGAALLGVGIWSLVSYGSFSQVLESALIKSAVYILIAVGGVVAVIAFCGCYGAFAENKCFLGLYAFILLLMLLAELAAAGLIFYIGTNDVKNFLTVEANKTFVKYGENKALTDSWDTVQKVGDCCGVIGPEDYQYTKFDGDEMFPESCCTLVSLQPEVYENTTLCYEAKTGYYNDKGCIEAFETYIGNNMYIAAGIAVGIALIQLIGIIGSCVVFSSIEQ